MNKFNPFAFTSYETFLLAQYQINCEGLFYINGQYLIFCPSVTPSTQSLEGSNLHQWLEIHKIMGVDISIVNQLPTGAIKVDACIENSKSPGTGYLITNGDCQYEITLLVPSIFPDYEIRWGRPIVIAFNEEITEDGLKELKKIFLDNLFPLPCQFIYDPSAKRIREEASGGFFSYILPSRHAKYCNQQLQMHRIWQLGMHRIWQQECTTKKPREYPEAY